ncbi:hypothetical protein [Hymenobacter terricola]|uniref:hypothetical protein n=1 Tax=Hymenobacter terricola TaxID=2819236 RepID=UPI001B30027F|nr:hypothetical protein [Hymenobacter terricola]
MSKRYLLPLVLLTLGNGALRAQESAASQTFKQRLRGQYLQNDTAQAIINLYSTRQFGGASWIVAAGLSAARIATANSTTTTNNSYVVNNDAPNAGAVFLVASPIAAYGVGKMLHYSNGHLEQVLTDYAAGKHLPKSLRRKLKRRFFKVPIIKYKPVKAPEVKAPEVK